MPSHSFIEGIEMKTHRMVRTKWGVKRAQVDRVVRGGNDISTEFHQMEQDLSKRQKRGSNGEKKSSIIKKA